MSWGDFVRGDYVRGGLCPGGILSYTLLTASRGPDIFRRFILVVSNKDFFLNLNFCVYIFLLKVLLSTLVLRPYNLRSLGMVITQTVTQKVRDKK